MTPLITNLFFKGLFSSSVSEVAMEAFVSNRSDSNSILYSSIQQKSDLIEQHTNLSQLMLWGRTIQLKWYRTKSFESSKDSELAWLQLVCVVITLLLATLVGVFENILAQAHRIASQKTKELGERDRLWTSLSRVAPVGIFQLDRQGRIIFVNDKWVEFTGVAASRAPEFHWLDSVDSGDLLQIQNKWAELEKGEIDMLQVQCRLSASSKMFALSLLAVAGESGDFSHFIGTLQDISEIHARQMQVMQSSRLATLGVMAAGVAHEINNPLTIITGRAQLIGRQLDSPQIPAASLKDSVAIIKQTVDRIAKIVRGLRAFSRAGDEDVFMPSSVSHMVQSTLEFCSERYRKGSVELRVKALPEILLSCREVQVCQVLLNLLNNGYDAVLGCPQPWVELEVVETEREVKFIVTDSGSGIPPEVAERIMVPFFTTKPIGQGTGLGLSISKGIAQDHRGDLVLDASSKNTRFIFSVSKHLSDDDSRQATA